MHNLNPEHFFPFQQSDNEKVFLRISSCILEAEASLRKLSGRSNAKSFGQEETANDKMAGTLRSHRLSCSAYVNFLFALLSDNCRLNDFLRLHDRLILVAVFLLDNSPSALLLN
jgi:hypothetical protein